MNDKIIDTDYAVERLCKANLNDLEMLYNAVYNRPQTRGYFLKKYDTAYTGAAYIGFIAYNDFQQPIAYYGVTPCFIRHAGQLVLAAQSVDTMTHPEYRYKRLFMQLAERTFELCRMEGINLIFGFPNQNSLPGFIKLGWQATEVMQVYEIPVPAFSLAGLVKKISFLKKAFEGYQQQVLRKYLIPRKGIESSVARDGFAGVNRDAAYLDYKTYSNTHVIRIVRSLIWIKISHALIIGDMSCAEEDFEDTMIELELLAFKLGLKQIQFQTCGGTKLSTLFLKRYKAAPAFHVIFKDLGTSIPLHNIKFTFADVDIF